MSKDNYISMVDMRSHLQRNYEKMHGGNNGVSVPGKTGAGVTDDKEVPAASASGTSEEKNTFRMPSIRKNSDSPVDKERRELEGKVIHDLAEVEHRIELLKRQQSEAERFYQILEKEHRELLELADKEDRGALARLQLEYFAASGRWLAFDRDSGNGRVIQTENQPVRRRGEWFVGAAVIAGSIIVSLAMVFLFR